MKEWCLFCEVFEPSFDPKIIKVCEHGGATRVFVLATWPTTDTQFNKLVSALREEFGLSKRRGPKRPITFLDAAEKIKEMPDDATPDQVAKALKVKVHTLRRAIKPLLDMMREFDPSRATFDGLQAILKGKRKPRARKIFSEKFPRR